MELKSEKANEAVSGMLLLIVPYGIEIRFALIFFHLLFAFNRTLWNWNYLCGNLKRFGEVLLIVPYGIEIQIKDWGGINAEFLLIVPYGIEICV